MNKIIAKVFVTLTVVVALIGQAMAYATMTCDMSFQITDPSSQHAPEQESAIIDHSAMDHSSMQHDHESMESDNEHCGSACECPTFTCNGFSYIATKSLVTSYADAESKIERRNEVNTRISNTSLYRPPIFA